MEYTTNYNLKKPGDQDNVLVGDLNENMDTVDGAMKELSDGKANLDPDTGKVPEDELPEFLKLIGGTMKGVIAMDGFPVSGLVDPAAADHAARKAYVDAQVATRARLVTGSYQGNGQNTMTLTLGFQPKVVIIWLANKGSVISGTMEAQCFYVGQPNEDEYSSLTGTQTRSFSTSATGFSIVATSSNLAMNYLNTISMEARTYFYAAFT